MSTALQGDGARVGAGESFSGVSSIPTLLSCFREHAAPSFLL